MRRRRPAWLTLLLGLAVGSLLSPLALPADQPLLKAADAIYLTVTSPEYAYQR